MGYILPRVALGRSKSPTVFDGTGILNLCYRDPGVGANLVMANLRDYPLSEYEVHDMADINGPSAFQRTGRGSRYQFDLSLLYETTRIGAPNNTGPVSCVGWPDWETNEGSMDDIASMLGLSTTGIDPDPAAPYLFLTTSFHCDTEFWIPVEPADSENSPMAPSAQTAAAKLRDKTFNKDANYSFVTKLAYQHLYKTMIPSKMLSWPGTGWWVSSMPAPGGNAPYTGTLTITNSAGATPFIGPNTLPQIYPGGVPQIVVGDWIIVRFSQWNWYRLTVTSITGYNIGFTTATRWPQGFQVGTLQLPYQIARNDPNAITPAYFLTDFAGNGVTGSYPRFPYNYGTLGRTA